MSVLVEGGLSEAILSQGAVKKHTNGQDSAGRFWQAARTNSSNPNLQIYVSDDKFATWEKHGLANLNVQGGASPSDVEPLSIEYACFVDSSDFIHVYWVQGSNNADLESNNLYHLYGKINSATSITWQPIRELVDTAVDTLSLGDMVAFVPSDDTAVMQCAFIYSRRNGSQEELRFHRTKFTVASPATYTDQADTLLDINATNPDRLRPVMTFRQASPHNEKTPHSTPHLYVVVSNERFKVEYYFGGYGFTSGNAFWTWSHGSISTARWIQGSASGVSLWHIVLWDGTNPVWFAQAVGSNGVDPILMYQRLNATSAAVLTDPEDANTSVAKNYSGGNAWIDRNNNRLYFAGCDNLTDHDLDYGYVNMNTGGFNFEQGEFEDQGVGNDPKLAVNRDGEFGYFMLLWDRETASAGHHVRAEPDITLDNHAPNTPTNLAVNPSSGTDTTPEFQCDVSDVDILEQIKGRFTVYESDGTTVVGTTDSSFRTGNGQVTKSYPTPLDTGIYKVAAAAVDDNGAVSGLTSQVPFSVLGTFSADIDLLLNIAQYDSADVDLILDIENTGTIDIDLVLDVTVSNSADIDLILDVDTGWVPVDDTPTDSIWSEVDASI